MIIIKYLLLSFAGLFIILTCTPCDGKVLMEYIGATGVPVSFAKVPVDANIEFHFLLGFAIDADPSGKPRNGMFKPYWASSLNRRSIQSLKLRHPNVKVLASLSGWSIGTKVLSWYNPKSPSSWISNAFTSLKSLATKNHLDGIDIDYETFPKNDTTFAFCVGELITRLKNEGVITVATIAPYYRTVDYYIELYRRYGDVIDYVNHQFYTDKVRMPMGYLEAFKLRAGQFNASKLLPSYEVDGRGIQGDAFFGALRLIRRSGFEVNGVMIFSADASQKNGYHFERKSQEFLINDTADGTMFGMG